MAMDKKFLLLIGIFLLIGIMNLISSYTAPAYNQINMTLTSGYIAPAYNQINFTLGSSDEIITINVYPVSAITLNGGTTKDINVLFNTSNGNVNETSAQVILTNGAVERTSSSCTNVSTEFNCTITLNFYDKAGVWNINASIIDNSANLITNTTENVTINTLDYIAQDKNYFKWGTLSVGVDNQEASNIITLTNGGNQDYATLNVKGQNATGVAYGNVISTNKFSADNITASTSGIHLEDNANVDMSSILNLNSHGASVTANIYAYVDVPNGIRADSYLSSSAWEITLI